VIKHNTAPPKGGPGGTGHKYWTHKWKQGGEEGAQGLGAGKQGFMSREGPAKF